MTADPERTITRGFLFADLRGYTDFVERRGAEAAAELLRRYRALAREAIGRFGGAEIKTEGDSFYVVFDSVSSAVRCGLAIVADAQGEDEPIPVGVGIHAGETIEADGGYVGSPVNIAARICAQAGPGEVLVSETVRALTMTLLPVRFKSRGRRQLKGIAEPIELFAVEEAPTGTATWPSTRRRRLSRRAWAALVGQRLPIRHMRLVDMYGPERARPADGDVTGAFRCRQSVPSPCVGGSASGRWSNHAYGLAIDVNPVENPYVGCERVRDPRSRPYLDRSRLRKGMVTPAVVRAFRSIGWGWGGDWSGQTKDYMHFSHNGR